jgi:hypothetical protein
VVLGNFLVEAQMLEEKRKSKTHNTRTEIFIRGKPRNIINSLAFRINGAENNNYIQYNIEK